MPWPPLTISSVVSAKGRLAAAINPVGQAIMVWSDQRSDAGDIYLQNYNADGTLGPLATQPPLPFSLISPADDDTSADYLVMFAWESTVDPDGGPITYDLVLEMHEPDRFMRVAGLSDTTDSLTWWDILGQPEHDWATVTWWVEALSGGDTTHSTETWQFVIPEEGAADDSPGIVRTMALYPAYPNPFNSSTTIAFDLPVPSFVTLDIYNLTGQHIATLVNGTRDVGRHSLTFDAANLPSGTYFYQLNANGFTARHKLLLLR